MRRNGVLDSATIPKLSGMKHSTRTRLTHLASDDTPGPVPIRPEFEHVAYPYRTRTGPSSERWPRHSDRGGIVKTNLTRLTLLLALTSAYVLVALAPAVAAG